MNIGDKVIIKGTNDIWEGKTGILEYLDETMGTVLVDFKEDKKVRQDFDADNIIGEATEPIETKEKDIIMTEEVNNMNNEELKKKLADYLGIEVDDVEEASYGEGIFTVSDEDAEYLVCTKDEAIEKAKEEVRNSFDDMGLDAFTPSFQTWIIENAVDYSVFQDMENEYYMQYVDEIEYENDDEFETRLYRELFDNGLLQDEDFEGDDHIGSSLKDDVYDNLDSIKSDYVDLLINTEDPMNFVNGMFEGKDLADFLESNNAIDIEMVAEEAVDEDGCGNFLAYYDSQEIDLGDGLLAYRLN